MPHFSYLIGMPFVKFQAAKSSCIRWRSARTKRPDTSTAKWDEPSDYVRRELERVAESSHDERMAGGAPGY